MIEHMEGGAGQHCCRFPANIIIGARLSTVGHMDEVKHQSGYGCMVSISRQLGFEGNLSPFT